MRILYSMGTRLYTSRVYIETERKKLNYTNSNACIDIPPSFEALMVWVEEWGWGGGLNDDYRRDNRERVTVFATVVTAAAHNSKVKSERKRENKRYEIWTVVKIVNNVSIGRDALQREGVHTWQAHNSTKSEWEKEREKSPKTKKKTLKKEGKII